MKLKFKIDLEYIEDHHYHNNDYLALQTLFGFVFFFVIPLVAPIQK